MKKGFTLVEAAIAAAILALAMTAFIGAFMSAKHSANLADIRMNKLHIARSEMENLLTRTYGLMPLGTWDLPGGHDGYYVVSSNPYYPNSVKDIAVTINWINPGANSTSSLSLHGSMSYELHQP